MTNFIIIRGPAGVGKTTIAQAVAKLLNGVHFNIDQVLRDTNLEIKDGDIPVGNFLKVQTIIKPKVIEYLEQGKPVVFDGNFYYQEQIDQLVKELSGKPFIFTLKASLETCWQRNLARKKNAMNRISIEAMYRINTTFEAGQVVDTEGKNEKEVIKELISAIM
ncbi:MAG: AAA family ATPase [Patescibacteria group bacterium]